MGRRRYTLEEKIKMVEELNKGLSNAQICKKYEITSSTLSTFKKQLNVINGTESGNKKATPKEKALEEEKIIKLKKIFKIDENIPNKKAMFELINPKLSSLLEVEKHENYGEIFYSLVEKLAKAYEIERFQIHNYDELVDLIMEKVKLEEKKDMGMWDKLIDKVDIFSLFTKEEIIKEVGQILLEK